MQLVVEKLNEKSSYSNFKMDAIRNMIGDAC